MTKTHNLGLPRGDNYVRGARGCPAASTGKGALHQTTNQDMKS
jgi:hypothetical protein